MPKNRYYWAVAGLITIMASAPFIALANVGEYRQVPIVKWINLMYKPRFTILSGATETLSVYFREGDIAELTFTEAGGYGDAWFTLSGPITVHESASTSWEGPLSEAFQKEFSIYEGGPYLLVFDNKIDRDGDNAVFSVVIENFAIQVRRTVLEWRYVYPYEWMKGIAVSLILTGIVFIAVNVGLFMRERIRRRTA